MVLKFVPVRATVIIFTSQSLSSLVKKFSAFHVNRSLITMITRRRYKALCWDRWINSTRLSFVLMCGNKMPTRCNRGFYCRSYCLLNMFRATRCPSSGAQEYYTVVAACGISCCGFQVAGLVWSWGLCVRFAGCCSILQTGHITLSSTSDQHEIPQAVTTV